MTAAKTAPKHAGAPGKAAKAAKSRAGRTRDEEMPAAGPHAKPHLMDPDRTPGTG